MILLNSDRKAIATFWTLYNVTIDLIRRKLFQDHEITTETYFKINNSALFYM